MTRARSSGSRVASLRMRCSTLTTGGRWAARPAPNSRFSVQNMAKLEHFGVQVELSATSCCNSGAAMCATCHVYLSEGSAAFVAPVRELENEMLESAASGRRENSRLGCQVVVQPGAGEVVVQIPSHQV